jgi:hypothetical protein
MVVVEEKERNAGRKRQASDLSYSHMLVRLACSAYGWFAWPYPAKSTGIVRLALSSHTNCCCANGTLACLALSGHTDCCRAYDWLVWLAQPYELLLCVQLACLVLPSKTNCCRAACLVWPQELLSCVRYQAGLARPRGQNSVFMHHAHRTWN